MEALKHHKRLKPHRHVLKPQKAHKLQETEATQSLLSLRVQRILSLQIQKRTQPEIKLIDHLHKAAIKDPRVLLDRIPKAKTLINQAQATILSPEDLQASSPKINKAPTDTSISSKKRDRKLW